MRILLSALTLLVSTAAFANGNLCERYFDSERDTAAIKAVAMHRRHTTEEMCSLPHLLDIEVQPSQVLTREGQIIPHTRVQLHSGEYSCLYMVRDADKAITSSRCYSNF